MTHLPWTEFFLIRLWKKAKKIWKWVRWPTSPWPPGGPQDPTKWSEGSRVILRTFHRGDFEGFGLGMKFDIRGVRSIFLGLDPKSEKFYMRNFFFGHFHLEFVLLRIYSGTPYRFQSIAKESVYRNKITASEKTLTAKPVYRLSAGLWIWTAHTEHNFYY